jgi:putative oxidoreductase
MTQAAYGTSNTEAAPAVENAAPYLATVGRLLLAAIFLISGFGKLTAATGTIGYIAQAGLPAPAVAYAVALLVELGGGILLVVGYQARLVAAALAVFSLATAFAFHANFGDQNQLIHFLKNVAIAGGLLQVVAFGAGGLSVDGKAARD